MRAEGDEQLLSAWQAGDERAGNELLERYFPAIFRFFARRLATGAEDLAQRTFLACVAKRDAVRQAASFRAFVFGVARNELLVELRRRERDEPMTRAPEATGPLSPSGVVAAREEEHVLAVAMAELPTDLRLVVDLYYWERLAIAEIADVVESPPGTVKWRLHRARELLRARIENMTLGTKLRDDTLELIAAAPDEG